MDIRSELASLTLEPLNVEVPHDRGPWIGLDAGHVTMQQDAYVLGPLQVGPVDLAEARRRAVLPEAELHFVGIEGVRLGPKLPPCLGVVGIRPELADRLSTPIERVEILPGDRPAAVGHPPPGSDIDRLQRHAQAVPVIGGATEKAKPCYIQICV